jgi:OOP family OmpA-OmpF porin
MTRKEMVLILCFTMTAAKTMAQELNVWTNDGWQGLSYKIQNGQTKLLPDGSLGLGYTFPVSRHWGLITGLTAGFSATRATLRDSTYSSYEVDNTGTAFRYDVKTSGYQETQRFFSFGIPLMLQYHTTGSRTQWYLNGGAELLLPFNAHIQSSARQLQLSGYYPDFNVNVSNVPQHGFGTVGNWRGSTTYALKTTTVAGTIETGVCFVLSSHTKFYTGVYFKYGLDDIKGSSGSAPLVPYSPNGLTGMRAGSVLNTPNAGDARAVAFGLQLRLGFGHFKSRSAHQVRRPEETKAPGVPSQQISTAPQDTSPIRPKDTPVMRPQTPRQAVAPADTLASAKVSQPASQPKISRDETGTIEQPVVFGVLGKTDLPERARPHLDEVAEILKKYPDVRILIIGHTCSIGTKAENVKVGRYRAEAVASYLVGRGVPIEKMELRSAGESNPAWPNSTPAGRSKNRRVTIECINKPFD